MQDVVVNPGILPFLTIHPWYNFYAFAVVRHTVTVESLRTIAKITHANWRKVLPISTHFNYTAIESTSATGRGCGDSN